MDYDGYDLGTFDFNSIMLYSSEAFAIAPGLYSLEKKDGSHFNSQRSYLSGGDKAGLNFLYGPEMTLQIEEDTLSYVGDDYGYLDFSSNRTYSVDFVDLDGNSVTLSYPRLVVIEAGHTYKPYMQEYSTYSTTSYAIAPVGISNYGLGIGQYGIHTEFGEVYSYISDWYLVKN